MLETRSNSQTQNKILAIEDDPEVLALYKQDLLSIFAFWSAVTGDYQA